MTKEYKCECEKLFYNPQSFNGHKSHCKIHQLSKYNNLDKYNKHIKECVEVRKQGYKKYINILNTKNQQKLQKWILEQHKCEKCGEIMTEKFGSGRFCSKSCANSRHHSEETKIKISKSLSGVYKNIRRDKSTGLYLNYCVICKKAFYGNTIYNQTCSKECLRELQHRKSLGNTSGGYREGSVKHFKYGYYKGFHCDSSYELAFIVYCLDHNIPIQRNKQWFEYSYLNKLHKYYPDFLVNNTTYVEIKNYHTDIVQAKIDYFPKDLEYTIIYKKDIQKYVNYCKQLYGNNFCEVLYEEDKPNYFNKM